VEKLKVLLLVLLLAKVRDRRNSQNHCARPTPESAIIDIGGGASRLADSLIAGGFNRVTVLDISEAALEATKADEERREIPRPAGLHAGGFFSAVSQPNRFAKVRDLGAMIYRRRIHVRLQLTCGRDTSR
jgi:methylase of polypeptide subunit release factors